jgi:hypothetical protein
MVVPAAVPSAASTSQFTLPPSSFAREAMLLACG